MNFTCSTDRTFSLAFCKNSFVSDKASCPVGTVYCLLGEAKNTYTYTDVLGHRNSMTNEIKV